MIRGRRLSLTGALLALLGLLGLLGLGAAGCSSARHTASPDRPPARAASASASASPSPSGWWATPAPRPHTTDALAAQMYHRMFEHRSDPCRHNSAPQLVRVSVRWQHLWMCARHRLVRGTPVTTGVVGQDTSTPTGRFTIQGLDRNATLTLITGQQYVVKYWIPFDGPLFGFHDSPWQHFRYGSRQFRTHGSHGCVHMPLRAIAFLYHWAHIGTPVRIE